MKHPPSMDDYLAPHLVPNWELRADSDNPEAEVAKIARAYLEAVAFGLLAGVAIMVSGAGGEFIYFQF